MVKGFLYEPFEKWWNGGKGDIYLYSDPHFGDAESYYLRGLLKKEDLDNYDKIAELDEMQLHNINAKVGKYGTIIILGDIGDINVVSRIKGYKVLIKGNHDSGDSNYKRGEDKIKVFNSQDLSKQEMEEIAKNAAEIMKDPAKVEALPIEKHFKTEFRDNHLFDEVYSGPLIISDRVILSHEPMAVEYFMNIHGHDHSCRTFRDNLHKNVCAEFIKYTPISLGELIKKGAFKDVPNIHRAAIEDQSRRALKNKREKQSY